MMLMLTVGNDIMFISYFIKIHTAVLSSKHADGQMNTHNHPNKCTLCKICIINILAIKCQYGDVKWHFLCTHSSDTHIKYWCTILAYHNMDPLWWQKRRVGTVWKPQWCEDYCQDSQQVESRCNSHNPPWFLHQYDQWCLKWSNESELTTKL
jgi:hypothetical protein